MSRRRTTLALESTTGLFEAHVTIVEHLLRQGQVPSPDVLYHYTSPGGLLGMLASGTIWASDLLYLNDTKEFQYAVDLVAGELERLAKGASAHDSRLLSEFAHSLSVIPAIRVYVASFSAVPDLLSQWRAYCPPTGGFAIGFVPKVLSESTKCLLTACIYDVADQRRLIGELFGTLLNEYRALPPDSEMPEQEIALAGLGADFLGGIVHLASVFKHSGFAEEREWRLVYRSASHADENVRFREGRGGIVPYVPLPLRTEIGLRVDEVIVGPNAHQSLAVHSVSKFLASLGVKHDGVRPSAIPYRTW